MFNNEFVKHDLFFQKQYFSVNYFDGNSSLQFNNDISLHIVVLNYPQKKSNNEQLSIMFLSQIDIVFQVSDMNTKPLILNFV